MHRLVCLGWNEPSRYIDSDPLFEELYDLDADYQETTNLATDPSYAKRIRQFREKLIQMRNTAK